MDHISASIMAHPQRQERAEQLAADLNAEGIEARVALDPAPQLAPSAVRCLNIALSQAGSSQYHVVLHDDVVVASNFRQSLQSMIYFSRQVAPSRLMVGLFAEWSSRSGQSVRYAALMGSPLASLVDGVVPCAGVLLDSELAYELSDLVATNVQSGATRDGKLLWSLAHQVGVTPLLSVPSLVQHDVLGSVSQWELSRVTRGMRRAACYTGEGTLVDDTERSARAARAALDLEEVVYISSRSLFAEHSLRATRESEFVSELAFEWLVKNELGGATAVAQALEAYASAIKERLPHLSKVFAIQVAAMLMGTSKLLPSDLIRDAEIARKALATVVPGAVRQILEVDNEALMGATAPELFLDIIRDYTG